MIIAINHGVHFGGGGVCLFVFVFVFVSVRADLRAAAVVMTGKISSQRPSAAPAAFFLFVFNRIDFLGSSHHRGSSPWVLARTVSVDIEHGESLLEIGDLIL